MKTKNKRSLRNVLLFSTATIIVLLFYTSYRNGEQVRLPRVGLLDNNIDNIFIDSFQNQLYLKQRRNHNISTLSAYKTYILNSKQEEIRQKENTFYLITEYTPTFGNTKYCQLKINEKSLAWFTERKELLKQVLKSNPREGEVYDYLDRCVYKNCFFTCDRSVAHLADVLMFHWIDFTNKAVSYSVKEYKDLYQRLFPFERPAQQVWLLWDDEAHSINPLLDKFKFNWTITYISLSEASFCSYGCYTISDKKTSKYAYASKFNDLVQYEFTKRPNLAIWFVSNCGPEKRMKIAAHLGQHFPINVYGDCAKTIQERFPSVSQSRITFNTNKCSRNSDCEQSTFRLAKFYLSFENSNCSDYITEKFWRSLHNDLIPIVMQPSREVYERVAPPDSFIHVADFDYDVERLAAYLKQVSNDFNAYKTYFEWKSRFRVVFDAKTVEQFRICELCARLNNQHLFDNSYYTSVSNFIESACSRN